MTRQFGRANTPPSGDALNALDLALKEAVLSSVSTLNGTASTALDSAASPSASASAIPSATGSDAISASASTSAIRATGSFVSESAGSAISSASAVSQSVVASATPSASSTPSQEASSAAPIPTTSVTSAAPRSASSSDLALSLPKNAAAVSSSSTEPAATPAPSTPASSTDSAASPKTNAPSASPAPSASAVSTEKNASPKSNTASSFKAAASTSVAAPAPSSSSVNSTVKLETTSSAAPVTSASTQDQPSPSTQVSSSSSNAVSTQRARASSTAAATPSNRNEQASSPSSSDAGAPQPTSAASPPQAIGTSNQAQNSPNTNLRGSQPSAANSPSPQSATNLGNSLIGASPSSTVHVDSTLSTPQAVTISSGSSTFVTTPAIFTSISVSSGKDGTPIATFTSVFANPTTVPQTASLSDSSFWNKKGAVAGVFTVVGLIMLASILGTFYLCRRQRRKTGRPFVKPAQFHRFSGPPEMSQQPTTYQPVRPRRFPMDDPQRYLLAPSITSGHSNGLDDPATMRSASRSSCDAHQAGALGLTGLLANSSAGMQDYHGPFSDYHRYISTGETRLSTPSGETVGMAVTTDFSPKESKPEREGESGPTPMAERRSTPSPAPSSPSIYPPSLPAVPETDEDDYLFYERETKWSRPESQLPTPPPRAVVNDAPSPRNPFSSPLDPVYDSAHKQTVSPPPPRIVTNQAYRPLTPPDSSAGHSPSTPQFSEPSESTKPLNVAPYSNTFLGRSVSMRTEPLPRPKRSPLRLSASGASLHQNSELP
ncbi:hypothetical protein ACEPAI_882 [Sanghuangporus weigelae]